MVFANDVRRAVLLRGLGLCVAGVAALLLSGCSVLGGSTEPVASYRLEGAGASVSAFTGEACCVLEVRTPLPAPGFATARMIYQRNDYQNEAFAYAEWVDTLPTMLRASMIDTFDSLGRFESVVGAPSPQLPDYRLESRGLMVIQRFDGQSSEVELTLRARVVDADERELLGARRFSVVVRAVPANSEGGVQAANEALDKLMDELTRYVLELVDG